MAGRRAWLLAGFLGLATAAMAADSPSPEETLSGKGLRKLSTTFALSEEAELTKGIRQAEALRRELYDAQKELTQRKKAVEDKRKQLLHCMEQRRQLREQLVAARSIEAHNRVVAALNEVGDRIDVLHDSKQEEQAQQTAIARVSQLTEQYLDQLLKARESHDQITAHYAVLASDTEVQHALELYNQTSSRTHNLGPTSAFLSNGRRLAKLEESVLSDTIELRRDRGGLWRLTVVFNGSHSVDMAIDTGASLVVLPWKLAEEAGLKPGEDDAKVQIHLADGRTALGRMVVADKVRVGRFTVENVECVVMPSEMDNAMPLLGMSFFKHFNFKVDSAAGKLSLARVEGSELARPGR